MWTHNIVEVMKNNIILYCRSNVQKRLLTNSGTNNQAQQQSQSQLQQQVELEPIINLKEEIKSLETPQQLVDKKEQQQQQQQQEQQAASVGWTLPDDKVVNSDMKDKYEILATGDLLIKDLKWADMGSYVCTVSDDQSSDSISTFVYPAAVKANSNTNSNSNSNNSNKRATLNPRHLAYFR